LGAASSAGVIYRFLCYFAGYASP